MTSRRGTKKAWLLVSAAMVLLLPLTVVAARSLAAYLDSPAGTGAPTALRSAHRALAFASRALWLVAIPGAFVILKKLALPLLKKVVFRIIRFLAIEELERSVFILCAVVVGIGVVMTIVLSTMSANYLGISNFYTNKGHFFRNGVAYVVNDAGHAVATQSRVYYVYYGMRLAFLSMQVPILISIFYVVLRKYIPLAYDVVNMIDQDEEGSDDNEE